MPVSTRSQSKLPAGYSFISRDIMISDRAKELMTEDLERSDNRCPDLHKMYIYNDYHAYGVLDLIDKRLRSIHYRIIKKDWAGAMTYLEALTHFMNAEMVWSGADDGEQVDLTLKAYGACLVATLRALKKNGKLTPENFPSLEYILKGAVELGDYGRGCDIGSDFDLVCKGVGKRLFKHIPPEEARALHDARFHAWLQTLPEDERKEIEEDEREAEAEEARVPEGRSDEKPWWSEGVEGIEDEKNPDFALSRVWNDYKEYMAETPNVPFYGPPIWDLDKWTEADKKPYTFETHSKKADAAR